MAIYPKRNLSKLGLSKYIHPYRLRGLEVTHSNHVWCIDITYIPMAKGFLYLTAIIDVYSRYIVGWDIHNTLDAENSLNVLRKAILVHGKPEIVNSDQGSQFTCPGWIAYLESQEITISMDGKGRALDNVWIERFWRTLKQEYVYICPAGNLKLKNEILWSDKWGVEYNAYLLERFICVSGIKPNRKLNDKLVKELVEFAAIAA